MIQVRRSNYRGKDGWTVSGHPPKSDGRGWPLRVFFEREDAARNYASLVRQGQEPEHIDWEISL